MAVRDYCWESIIHGHQIYKTMWMPEISEFLCCEQGRSNHEDSYAVRIYSLIYSRSYTPSTCQLFRLYVYAGWHVSLFDEIFLSVSKSPID